MRSKRWQHPDRKACKAYIQEMITWEHLLLTKIVVLWLAGLKIMAAKAFFALSVMLVTLFNVAPQYSRASDPTPATNWGAITAGDTSGGRGAPTNWGAITAGDTNGGTTTNGGAATAGGDTNGGTTNGDTPTPSCSEWLQQGCTTNLAFPCQQGLQTCQWGSWSTCRPVGQAEVCTDTFDNDCDGSIDGQDSDCTDGGAGCTNPQACNFNQQATDDDGSCILPTWCTNRCPGDAGSPKTVDQCGICGGDNGSCSDCAGTPNGNKLIDQCNVCLSPNDPQFNACLDCAGTPNGNKQIDSCDNCLAPDDPKFNSCKDCKGIQGGEHKTDQCGACLLPTDDAFDACIDCAGVPFGAQKPGSACNDGNPKTTADQRAVDCSCVWTLIPTQKQPDIPPKPETPTQEPPLPPDTTEQPNQQESPQITPVTPTTPTTPTIWQSSVPQDTTPSANPSHEAPSDVTPQEDDNVVVNDIPARTSKVLRIPILTTVRARLHACIATKGNVLSCLLQSQKEEVVTSPIDTTDMCCTLPLENTDRSPLSPEERVLIQQMQERNCLFRDKISDALHTPAGLDAYITTQEVEHVLFHIFGGNVAPQEDSEHRRYRLQAKEILPAWYQQDAKLPITYASLTSLLQRGLLPRTTQQQFLALPRNDHLVTWKEALPLFGKVSQFFASRNTAVCEEKPLRIERFPISKQQNDTYLACREQKSLSSCSHLLWLPTPKTESFAHQIAACETVFGADHPDCLALKQPKLMTQTTTFDCTQQQAIAPSECASLVALYNATNGPSWSRADGWLENNALCTRYGVSCSQGNVSHLTLANNNLRGILPELYFPALQQLQLQGNMLAGNLPHLPESNALKKLFLHDNAFVGTIPTSYADKQMLTHLYLGGSNQLCWIIPSGVRDLPLALAHTDIDTLQFMLQSCPVWRVCNVSHDCTSNACNADHICIAPTSEKQDTLQTLKTKAQSAWFTIQSLPIDSSTTTTDTLHITTYMSCLARGHTSEQCQRVLRPNNR
jgi:hypothetical protein